MGIFILVLIILIVGFWVLGFAKANDFSIPTIKKLPQFNKVLVVFPHPDDEAQSMGGLMTDFSKLGVEVELLILTKGEKGNKDGHLNEGLKWIRVNEVENAARFFGIKKLAFRDYPDNDVSSHKTELTKDLQQVLTEINPDLVVTYDESGLYGHPDHIVVSEVLTDLIKKSFPNVKLWYTSVPKKLLDQIKLPEHMAIDKEFKSRQKYPTFKYFIGIENIINKTQAIYGYKSQFNSFKEAVPIKLIPLWFYISIRPYEYFFEVK